MSDNELNDAGTVAHYSKLEHVANILHEKQLLLSPVKGLADPRESSLEWIQLVGIGQNCHEPHRQSAEKIKTDAKHQIRLLCTIRPKTEEERTTGQCPIEEANYGRSRMWAQYADQSKGFCVVLDRKLLDKKIRELTQNTEHAISGEVIYYEGLHGVIVNVDIEHGLDNDPSKRDAFEWLNHNNMMNSIFFKKSEDWKQEYEYRWLLYNPNPEPERIPVSIEGVVKAVVLGPKFPTNQYSQVKEYCRELKCDLFQLNYPHPQYNCKRIRLYPT